MAISASAQVRTLATAVATAFASANLTDAEKRPEGGIAITDLPWSCPPLITPLVLGGAMQDHLDAPVNVSAGSLYKFWLQTMRQMWYEPSRVMKGGVYANLSTAMPAVKKGQRALRFSTPIGAPSQLDRTAGVTLSLEVAHCAAVSLPVADIYSDDSSYVVTATSGEEFGVRAGLPLIDSPWDYNATGEVADMMLSPRGAVSYTCHYDQIASVRSIVHTNAKKFPYTFEALDQALQALRYLSLGGYCPELTTQLVIKPMEELQWKEKERAYRDALDVVRSNMSDKSKLYSLRNLLVPQVMTVSKFKREIFSASQFPFSLAVGRLDEIEASLIALYKNEVPIGLQQVV